MRCPKCWKQYVYVPMRLDGNRFFLCGICNYKIRDIKPPKDIPCLHIPKNYRQSSMDYWDGSKDNAQQTLEKDYRDGKR